MTDAILTPTEHVSELKRKTYSAILNLASRHPMLDASDLALMLGANVNWVRKVMSSDAFKAQRAQKVQELFGPQLAAIQAKMLKTTEHLIDAIHKRIADPEAAVTEETLLKATSLLLDRILPMKAAPAIAPPAPAQHVQMIFNGISPDDIDRARQAALERGRALPLEHQIHDNVTDVDEDGVPQAKRVRSNEGID